MALALAGGAMGGPPGAAVGAAAGVILGVGVYGLWDWLWNENTEDVEPSGQDRLPPGSKPIDETPWSGDHGKIKDGIGNCPDDDTWISPDDRVWNQNPDGTYNDHGYAGDYTGSGKPSGRRGKDRKKPWR